MKKSVALFLAFISVLFLCVANARIVRAAGSIYIKADGSVEGTDNIQRNGEVYTLTGDIAGSTIIQRDNIVIDGASYTLQGKDGRGIVLSQRHNVTVKNVKIELDGGYGIDLTNTTDSTISENQIIGGKDLPIGLNLLFASNNTIEENTITNTFRGISIDVSYNNSIIGNNVTNGVVGIELQNTQGNVLRNNRMSNNSRNFSVRVYPSYVYANDVDASNTIDGAPIYYWLNEQDKTVPSDAAFVVLVNCTRIMVQNLNLTKNGAEILLAFTTNSTIAKNTLITNRGGNGINLVHSLNNNIIGNNVQNQSSAIELDASSNNTIAGNNFVNNDRAIRPVYSSNGNVISNNNVTASSYGIEDMIEPSSNNVISGNNIAANDYGISIRGSSTISDNIISGNKNIGIIIDAGGCIITGNNVTNNGDGIVITSGNTLRNNRMENNTYNLRVQKGFQNDIDMTNTVDGKPVIYWVNQRDKTVPSDAGYVALVNCAGITVQNLTLANHGAGILLAYTTNSTLTGNVITNKSAGILFYGSLNNQIVGNNITTNQYAIYISFEAAFLGDSRYVPSSNNLFHHNNFMNNNQIVYDVACSYWVSASPSVNIWDNGKEGNYWSDYIGKDNNSDGIGDTPYVVYADNSDRFPLIAPATVIPEFPSLIIPTYFLTTILIVAIVYRRKHNRIKQQPVQ
jgi:parallel beta-helix repeat protein